MWGLNVSVLVGFPCQGWWALWPSFIVTTSLAWRRQGVQVNIVVSLLHQRKTHGAPCFIKMDKVFQSPCPCIEHSVVAAPKQMLSCYAPFLVYMAALLTQWTWTKPSDLLPAATSVLINTSVSLCARPNQAAFASSCICCPLRRARAVQLDRSCGSEPALKTRWLRKIMMNEGLTGEKWLLWIPYWSASWGLFHVEPKFDISNGIWLLNSSCNFRHGSDFRWNLGHYLEGETEAQSMEMTYPM